MNESEFFPPVELADPDGLLAVGGQLDPAWILDAYRHGVFPWPTSDGWLTWWSPDPRPVIELEQLHVSRRLARTVRSGRFQVTCNRDFDAVIEGCATAQNRERQMWLIPEMRAAYKQLHRMGHTHSVEVWRDGQLAGGTYGVAVGRSFSAESMFHYVRDASKVALVWLVAHLKARGFDTLDIQQVTPHTARLGASKIPREVFLQRLSRGLRNPAEFGTRLEGQPS